MYICRINTSLLLLVFNKFISNILAKQRQVVELYQVLQNRSIIHQDLASFSVLPAVTLLCSGNKTKKYRNTLQLQLT